MKFRKYLFVIALHAYHHYEISTRFFTICCNISLLSKLISLFILYLMYYLKVDGQRFRAHKNILAATIPYFERMFLSDFQESNMEIVPMMNITAS